jgi:exosortase
MHKSNLLPDRAPAAPSTFRFAGDSTVATPAAQPRPLASGLIILAPLFAWCYGPTLIDLVDKWLHNPSYSHGLLVPCFAAYVIWARRKGRTLTDGSGTAFGYALLGAALVARIGAAVFGSDWGDAMSMLLAGAAAVVLLGGLAALRWALPGILFLIFMVPLPYRLEISLGYPLQRIATIGSTFFLQVLGLPAISEGNTILINDFKLGIVEACSGLRMLMTFFAFSTAVAMLIRRGPLEKLAIVASAVPIALLVNMIRITATGVMFQLVSSEAAKTFFHDLAGWVMMPLCLAFLAAELWALRRLVVEAPADAVPAGWSPPARLGA